MITCTVCNTGKPLDAFWRGSNGTRREGRVCRKCSSRRRHLWNNERVNELLLSEKLKPCTDCGQRFPHYVMEFDHARGEKKFNVSRGGQLSKVIKEVAKCDVVCANCHNARTHFRRVLI